MTMGLEAVAAHHSYGTHAAPWHLAEAIKSTGCQTDDINLADAIYVCVHLWSCCSSNNEDDQQLSQL